jgi:hypothetical protein
MIVFAFRALVTAIPLDTRLLYSSSGAQHFCSFPFPVVACLWLLLAIHKMTSTRFFLDPPEGVDFNICRAPSWQLMGLRDASNAVEVDML